MFKKTGKQFVIFLSCWKSKRTAYKYIFFSPYRPILPFPSLAMDRNDNTIASSTNLFRGPPGSIPLPFIRRGLAERIIAWLSGFEGCNFTGIKRRPRGQLGMDKAEKAGNGGSWFGFRRGLKGGWRERGRGGGKGQDFVRRTKAIRGEKGGGGGEHAAMENRRMTPGCRRISGAAKSISRPRCRVQQVFVGEEGKNRKKREKKEREEEEGKKKKGIRERNSQNAPSTRFVPFPSAWNSMIFRQTSRVEMIFERRWFRGNSKCKGRIL